MKPRVQSLTVATAVIVGALLLGFSGSVQAQDKLPIRYGVEPTRYEFEDDLVTGDLVRPDGEGIICSGTHRSRPLIRVRGNFVAQMVRSLEHL